MLWTLFKGRKLAIWYPKWPAVYRMSSLNAMGEPSRLAREK